MTPPPPDRIPDVGDDGLHRLECRYCRRLLCRFPDNAQGGPWEFQCTRPTCKRKQHFYFNATGEVLRSVGVPGGG